MENEATKVEGESIQESEEQRAAQTLVAYAKCSLTISTKKIIIIIEISQRLDLNPADVILVAIRTQIKPFDKKHRSTKQGRAALLLSGVSTRAKKMNPKGELNKSALCIEFPHSFSGIRKSCERELSGKSCTSKDFSSVVCMGILVKTTIISSHLDTHTHTH